MKRRLDGVLLLDKPVGLTSNQALQKVKRLYRAEKAGHTGTLDPFATGLLPLCFGEATKFSQFLLEADKVYDATLLLGVRTSSGDLDGDVISRRAVQVSEAEMLTALTGFVGEIEQVPPMHSALKHHGRPLYEYARQGVEIERSPRPVTVYSLDLLELAADRCRLRVHSGKGFYVRALADDLGEQLGCGAHLTGLRRLASGPFDLDHGVDLPTLEELDEAGRDACLLPADAAIERVPRLDLGADAAWQISHGQPVWLPRLQVGDLGRLYDPEGRFLGLAEVDPEGRLAPRRLIASS